jgi:DNA-binding NarL/FixJ family response regulator
MDVSMPEMDGLEATRMIKRELPDTVVLMITAFEDPNYLAEALKAGSAGYISKHTYSQQIVEAIRKVLEGEFPLNQEIAVELLRRLLQEEKEEESRPLEEHARPSLPQALSPREIEVLRLLARGQTNQQIARTLLISMSTVKKHVHHVFSKLEVSDRTQAALKAFELGLLNEQQEE